jgi:DNA-binding NtrC family response regulator
MRSYPWRGNVRELQNVIEHAVVLAEPGQEIQPENIPFREDERGAPPPTSAVTSDFGEESYHTARERLLDDFERRYLVWLVERAGGNMSKAARIAGVDRTTLYRLMERHGLRRATLAGAEQ